MAVGLVLALVSSLLNVPTAFADPAPGKGDLCWDRQAARIVLPGDDGEHWLVTGPDGTRYAFGSDGAAKSAWTVPAFGNDAGEPSGGLIDARSLQFGAG
ncbi:hypothetical protein AB0H12_23945 [Actinosynnema sp. NPDC023794]